MDKLLETQVRGVHWLTERWAATLDWLRRDDGQEAGVEKLILIGAAIAVAVAATAVFINKFGQAKDNIDVPTKASVAP